MITLEVAYDDNSENLVNILTDIIPRRFPLVKLTCYHENLFKERKKSFKLKGKYSARKNPFAVLADTDKNIIKAFYSESGDCTYKNIIDTLSNYVVYNTL